MSAEMEKQRKESEGGLNAAHPNWMSKQERFRVPHLVRVNRAMALNAVQQQQGLLNPLVPHERLDLLFEWHQAQAENVSLCEH